MVRYYLNEEPILHSAPTYMPMFEKDRKEAPDRMGELVIKDVAGSRRLRRRVRLVARQGLRGRIWPTASRRIPRRFIAQEVIQFRDIDVIDPDSGEVSPRKCDLRAFVVTGQNTHVVVFRPDALLVSARPDDRQLVAGRRIRGYVGAGARRRQHGQAAR